MCRVVKTVTILISKKYGLSVLLFQIQCLQAICNPKVVGLKATL